MSANTLHVRLEHHQASLWMRQRATLSAIWLCRVKSPRPASQTCLRCQTLPRQPASQGGPSQYQARRHASMPGSPRQCQHSSTPAQLICQPQMGRLRCVARKLLTAAGPSRRRRRCMLPRPACQPHNSLPRRRMQHALSSASPHRPQQSREPPPPACYLQSAPPLCRAQRALFTASARRRQRSREPPQPTCTCQPQSSQHQS